MGIGSPVLSAQSPVFFSMCTFEIFAGSPVFGIKEYAVHTYLGSSCLQLARYLQNNTYAAGSVIGTVNRCLVVGWVRIIVRPGTAVPVRA